MAVVVGNLPFLPDLVSPRTIIIDRRNRSAPLDVALNLPKLEISTSQPNPCSYSSFSFTVKGLEFDGENPSRNPRVGVRGKVNSKVNAVDFDSNTSDEENGNDNGGGEDEEGQVFDWEAVMRKRMKELEEMKELEKKAEELQGEATEKESEGSEVEETEEEKKMRVRKELEKVAREQAERRETAKLMFDLGQKAYGRGMYGRSIEFLEAALTIIPRPTVFGGEIQIWLAMAYEAYNRHSDCVALYKELEAKHPSSSIRRQAAELRYIMQAPKIKITQEERVSIPLIGSPYDSYAGTWSDKYKDRDQNVAGSITNQLNSSRDFMGDLLKWKPPSEWEKNRALWVTVAFWLGLVSAALFLQR